MSQQTQGERSAEETSDRNWKSLYGIGAAAAWVATVLFLSDIVVMISGGSMIGSASDWFTLMQKDRVAGILQLFFTDLAGLALLIPFVFGLYGALRRVNAVYAGLAAIAAFMGIGVVFATNSNYSLLYLSHQHAAAATEMQSAQILAVGESLLATGLWGTGYLTAGFLIEGALVIVSVLMLKSDSFGKGLGWLGILGHGLDCLHALALLVLMLLFNPDLAAAIGVPMLAAGGTLQLVWYPLVARKLFQLGRGAAGQDAGRN